MTAAVAMEQRFFRGKTLKIQSVNRVEVLVDLPFDLCLKRTFTLSNLGFNAEQLADDVYNRAQHALVVILGGKKIIVEPDASSRDKWGSNQELGARMFLIERVHGRPVGLSNGVLRDPVLEVAPFFSWIAERDFDLSEVKRVLNGKGVPRG